MTYHYYELKLTDLIRLIEGNKIDLKPSYQRNEVWSKKDQQSLIDSILAGFPIPNFFIYKKPSGSIEMVDGQQRARAIYNFYKGQITDSNKISFNTIKPNDFLDYKINITEIDGVVDEDSIRKFYVLVNKKGVQLNASEINKADFAATKFMLLVEEILENQNFSNLELFTDATVKRMNDRSYVEELVVYLLKGITDKKLAVEKTYETDIDDNQYVFLKSRFESILERLTILNTYTLINKSRYKQRNDFYTLFNFINSGLEIDSVQVLLYQYRILLMIEKFISPSNDECEPFKYYANNCITQSNSKKARTERLLFFEELLRNKETDKNESFQDVTNFLVDIKEIKQLKKINEYLLFDIDND